MIVSPQSFFLLSIGSLLYYLVALLGMSIFSFQPSNITILWLPFGIGVILVHHFGLKALPFIFTGSFFANYTGMINESPYHYIHTLIAALADTLAPMLSSYLIRKHVNEKFDRVKILLPFTFYAVIIPTFISSIIISFNLHIGGYIPLNDVYSLIPMLIFADGLGLLLLYPIYQTFRSLPHLTLLQIQSALLYSVVGFLLIWCSFYLHFFIFIVLPLLLIAAFRIRTDLLMIILLVLVIEIISLSTLKGHIFTLANTTDSILMLIAYLSSLIFVILGISLHHTELITNMKLSYTDTLTQTKNSRAYHERINELLSLYQRYTTPFSIILFDIDNFKAINDTYGHRIGDIVLSDLSSLVQKNIRVNDTLFRVGGEEFVILLPTTSLHDALDVAEKIRSIIAANLTTIENRTITISLGVTEISNGDDEDIIYRRVDSLLYISKANGKNKITSDSKG